MGKVDRRGLTLTSLHVLDDLQAHLREAHRRIVEYFRQQCGGDWARLAGYAYAESPRASAKPGNSAIAQRAA